MKTVLGLAGLLIASLVALPASAGTLYKCVGADGVSNYVSKRIRGASCSAVSNYRASAPAPRSRPAIPVQPVVPAAPPPAPQADVKDKVATAAQPVAASSASPTIAVSTVTPPVRSSSAPRVVSGQVYSYMKDGVRHYTSSRPAQVASLGEVRTIRYSYIERCYACGIGNGVNFGTVRLNTSAFQNEIAAAAREFGVEEAVVRAIIHAESAYNPSALSKAGAQGLMQLMPATARRFGVTDAYNAPQNIRGGVQYLAWLLRRFNNDLTLAAAGYNAGEGAVDRHGGVPPYRETQYYVRRVAQLAERYRSELRSRQ